MKNFIQIFCETMNLYKNKKDGKVYIVFHLKIDMKNLGIYATPFHWQGKEITYLKKDVKQDELFEPQKFFEENFEKIVD